MSEHELEHIEQKITATTGHISSSTAMAEPRPTESIAASTDTTTTSAPRFAANRDPVLLSTMTTFREVSNWLADVLMPGAMHMLVPGAYVSDICQRLDKEQLSWMASRSVSCTQQRQIDGDPNCLAAPTTICVNDVVSGFSPARRHRHGEFDTQLRLGDVVKVSVGMRVRSCPVHYDRTFIIRGANEDSQAASLQVEANRVCVALEAAFNDLLSALRPGVRIDTLYSKLASNTQRLYRAQPTKPPIRKLVNNLNRTDTDDVSRFLLLPYTMYSCDLEVAGLFDDNSSDSIPTDPTAVERDSTSVSPASTTNIPVANAAPAASHNAATTSSAQQADQKENLQKIEVFANPALPATVFRLFEFDKAEAMRRKRLHTSAKLYDMITQKFPATAFHLDGFGTEQPVASAAMQDLVYAQVVRPTMITSAFRVAPCPRKPQSSTIREATIVARRRFSFIFNGEKLLLYPSLVAQRTGVDATIARLMKPTKAPIDPKHTQHAKQQPAVAVVGGSSTPAAHVDQLQQDQIPSNSIPGLSDQLSLVSLQH
jgi:hypothetical protein